MFPEYVKDAVLLLRKKYEHTKSCVVLSYPILEIIRSMRNYESSTKLFYFSSSNTFEIQAPSYTYFSKISHFDFRKSERRWTRNKGLLFSLIKDLKFCGLWEYVSNKDFLVVNVLNKRAKTDELWDVLNKVIGD